MHEERKFLVGTSTAHNIPLITYCRHKNFKDLMYGSTYKGKIKFETTHFCKGDYQFP